MTGVAISLKVEILTLSLAKRKKALSSWLYALSFFGKSQKLLNF